MTERTMTRAMTRAMGVADTVDPADYSVAFQAASYQLGVDADAVGVDVEDAEVGARYDLTISSDGGGDPVVVSDNVAATAFSIENIDCSGLTDGELTAELILTDAAGNAGDPATDTADLLAA